MVKIVYKVLVYAGQEQAFLQLATDVLIPEAQKTPGCLLFSLFQNTTNPRECIFLEQWDGHASVDAYKQRLLAVLGGANPGEEFPAKMNELIEEDEDLV